jgi:gliding motility-associated-like protein
LFIFFVLIEAKKNYLLDTFSYNRFSLKIFYMKIKNFSFIFLLFFFFFSQKIFATHIRAGEITAERISTQTLTYRITVVGYTDTRSSVIFGPGDIFFGDGRQERLNTQSDFVLVESLGNQIEKNTFVITHTYQGPGEYVIRFKEFNRNDLTLNMDNSVDTPFYVETMIRIDPFFGINNSPVLTIPPVDNGAVNLRYIHNPGAYDPDGDSLAYVMDVPKQEFQRPVNNYRSPGNAEFSLRREDGGVPAFLSLDPITGDLVWDSPGFAGQYNIAFRILEYRKINGEFRLIGYVVRDMQIIIENTDNKRPELILPDDLCVEAGTRIEEIIQGSDPDGDPIKIELFGDPLEISTSPATFSPQPSFLASPLNVTFNWQTVCAHAREREYEIRVRITDKPKLGPSLVDIKTFKIKVIGPPPVLTEIEQLKGRAVLIKWDPYVCSNNAEKMQVWRRINSDPYEPDSCETGIRSGYQLVGTTDMGTFELMDNNNGNGLDPGNTYCYRLVAVFPDPRAGESIVSQEFCITIDVDVPLITNVSIEKTGTTDGEIFVKWTPPYDLDRFQFPGPLTYELIRSTGLSGNQNRVSLLTTSDTTFTDTNLNTSNLVYNYRVVLRENGTVIDSSSTASSVRLNPTIINEAIELKWNFQVPWNNSLSDFKHDVYRNRNDDAALEENVFVKIAEVDPVSSGFVYLDNGGHNNITLKKDIEYCYYIVTKGAYNIPQLVYPFENKSQLICARPDDNRLPCPPRLTFEGPDCAEYLSDKTCATNTFEHELSWAPNFTGVCDNELSAFRLYFDKEGEGESFDLIRSFQPFEFNTVIEGLNNYKGCYYITAVDRSGNESAPSNTVCVDNCPNFELPNAFTPNGDGINDTFMAYDNPFGKCPRFVESVEIEIVNRWGVEVFRYSSLTATNRDIYIRWDGKDKKGNDLPAGAYFYSAVVRFDVVDPDQKERKMKGTVQIIK